MKYSLTTYNIFKLHLPLSRQYVSTLERNNDFLLLQEWVSSLTPQHTKYKNIQETFTLPLKKETTGTATISSFPPVTEEKLLSLSRELGFTTHKSAILTTYLIEGGKLTILNCHALNFVENSTWKKTMDYWISKLPDDGPCVVAGDFNVWNPGRTDHLRKILLEKGFSYAPYKHSIPMCLDHIWYRHIVVTSCILHDRVHTSDHYPITITFDM